MIKRIVIVTAFCITSAATAGIGATGMNLKVLKSLPECNKEETAKLENLFQIGWHKGGAGGSIIKWMENTESIIIFPGQDGQLHSRGGAGGAGANPEWNIKQGAVIKVNGHEEGLEISLPGYRGFLSWDLIDDIQRMKRSDEKSRGETQ